MGSSEISVGVPLIRPIEAADWADVWSFMGVIVRDQETFPYEPNMTSEQAHDMWIVEAPGQTVVAVDDGRVVGTAQMGTNRPGPGSHISTGSFMVAEGVRGRGVGTALCRYVMDWARGRGYAGMQFNAVVETNHSAVSVYERLGFRVVGTVPGAFAHPTLGRVGLHIMYCQF